MPNAFRSARGKSNARHKVARWAGWSFDRQLELPYNWINCVDSRDEAGEDGSVEWDFGGEFGRFLLHVT